MKRSIFLIYSLMAAGILFGFEISGNNYLFSLDAGFTCSFFGMDELVYNDSGANELLSYLSWDSGLQIGIMTGIEFGPEDKLRGIGIGAEGLLIWNLPFTSGNMTDLDWYDTGEKYSEGESLVNIISRVEGYFTVRALIPFKGRYIFGAGSSLWYMRTAAAAHDGAVKQVVFGEEWGGALEEENLYGVSILYIQEWFSAGVSLYFSMAMSVNNFIEISGVYHPFIMGYHIDNHFFRKIDEEDKGQRYITYEDEVSGGAGYSILGKYIRKVSDTLEAGFYFEYRKVKDSRGGTVIKTTGLTGYIFTQSDVAGAGAWGFSAGVFIKKAI